MGGVTNSGRVWRKVLESDTQSMPTCMCFSAVRNMCLYVYINFECMDGIYNYACYNLSCVTSWH